MNEIGWYAVSAYVGALINPYQEEIEAAIREYKPTPDHPEPDAVWIAEAVFVARLQEVVDEIDMVGALPAVVPVIRTTMEPS